MKVSHRPLETQVIAWGGTGDQMGIILCSFDWGRRAEYLTSVLLSPYAITIPIRGHDDRVESDFLCVGLEAAETDGFMSHQAVSPSLLPVATKSLIPDLRLLFWVQTKSQSTSSPQKIEIDSRSKVDSILNNKMPYFIAMVHPQLSPPTLSLYATSERVAFKHLYPDSDLVNIHFIPGFPADSSKMYSFEKSSRLAIIYMGEPFLEFKGTENLDRTPAKWMILKDRIEMDYFNFIYATAGLGCYKRSKWNSPETEEKIFFPENGQLTSRTLKSIHRALEMLNLTLIEQERHKDPNSDTVKAMDILLHFLRPPDQALPSPENPED